MRPIRARDLRHDARLVHGFYDDMTDPLGYSGDEFLGAFAGSGKAQALGWPPGAEGALHFASRRNVQGIGMGAKTPQQTHVWIGLDGITNLEALGEGLAQGLTACCDILHKVDITWCPKALGDVYEGRVHREHPLSSRLGTVCLDKGKNAIDRIEIVEGHIGRMYPQT